MLVIHAFTQVSLTHKQSIHGMLLSNIICPDIAITINIYIYIYIYKYCHYLTAYYEMSKIVTYPTTIKYIA